MPHRNVVKDVRTVGEWTSATAASGKEVRVELDVERESGTEYAILLQAGVGGEMLGVGRI